MELTTEQLARIEENRQKALAKRQLALEREQEEQKKVQIQDCISHQEKKELQQQQVAKPTAENTTCECLDETGDVCGHSPVDEVLFTIFEEQVCKTCKKKTDLYDLIPKAECTTKYLLPEDTVKIMKFQQKDNPYNAGWIPMKLFLRKHAIALAIHRFGSEKGLEAEKKKREEKKFEKSLEQTENILTSSADEYRLALDSKSTLSSGSLSASLEEVVVVRRSGGISGIGNSGISSSSSGSGLIASTFPESLNPDNGSQTTSGKRKAPSAKQSAAAKKKKFLLDMAAVIRGDT